MLPDCKNGIRGTYCLNALRLAILLALLLSPSFYLFSQSSVNEINGRIIDSGTMEPLAFVNISINEGRRGVTTDIDGKFTIRTATPVSKITCTYVGYKPLAYEITGDISGSLVLEMERTGIDLPEVTVYAKENPAHRIINLAVENRDKNDHENLGSFSYTSYERTIMTVQLDSLLRPDPLITADTLISDSSYNELKEFFDKQDLAIIETVTERKFLAPDKNYRNVIANRVSGFRDPIFVFLLSQLQSTTFYSDMFHLLDKHYVNPVSRGSTKKYFFRIEDTTFTQRNDTVFIISYRPRINTNFDGMKGVLSINSNGWAIQNVIARPAEEEGFRIKIQQKYELIDGEQWFPVQLNTDITFFNAQVRAGTRTANMVAGGKTYIKNIEINPQLVRREFDILGIDVEPDSHDKPDDFWQAYRIDSLSERDRRTYEFMDSIGQEANLDRTARIVETMMTGKIPVKFIDIDLAELVKYNAYQGWYFGIGLHTNERLSKRVKLGGFWGYGLKDRTAKYGADASYLINRRNEIEIRASYSYDLLETGGVLFEGEKQSLFDPRNWGDFLVTRMNLTEDVTVGMSARLLRDFKFHAALSSNSKQASYDYMYGISEDGLLVATDRFHFTELKLGFRFAFREEFLVTKRARVSLGTKYPIVRFQYTRGFDNFLMGDFNYNRFDLRVSHSFYTRYLGRTYLEARGGFIQGSVPYSNLYNGNASFRQFTVYAPSTFSTMRMNEFVSDRYVSFFFVHNFGSLLFKAKNFRPEFLIATHAALGNLVKNRENHFNIGYNTLEHGYFESGLLINKLLDLNFLSLGVGAFYRYGAYSLSTPWENLALKFSIVLPFYD